MTTITITGIDEALQARLRARAAANRRTIDEEIRAILAGAVIETPQPGAGGLGTQIRALFAPLGEPGLALPERVKMREPPRFE